MWIDFKIVFLCEQSQVKASLSFFSSCCELISKLYFCVSNHKIYPCGFSSLFVVNWFQNCIFVWAITRSQIGILNVTLLWIDFKIVFLCEQSQECLYQQQFLWCCELISKLYFCVSNHKWCNCLIFCYTVVNWFQNCIFVWAITRSIGTVSKVVGF